MMRNKRSRLAIGDLNELVNEHQAIQDEMARVQREKDLEVDTIEKQYEAKIDMLSRKEKELSILIRDTKEFVKSITLD